MAKIADNAGPTAFSDKEVTAEGPQGESVDTTETMHVPAKSIPGKTQNPGWTKDTADHLALDGIVDSQGFSVNASDSDKQQIIAETIDENLDIVDGEMKRLVNTGGSTAGPNSPQTAGNVNTPRAADGATVTTEDDGVTDALNRDDLTFREDQQTGTMPTDNRGRSGPCKNRRTPVKTENNNITTWNSKVDEQTAVNVKIKSYNDDGSSENHGTSTNGCLDEAHVESGSEDDRMKSSEDCSKSDTYHHDRSSPVSPNNPPSEEESTLHADRSPNSRGEGLSDTDEPLSDRGESPSNKEEPMSDRGDDPSDCEDSGDSSATEDLEYPPRSNAGLDTEAGAREESEGRNGGQVIGGNDLEDTKKTGDISDEKSDMGCNLKQDTPVPHDPLNDIAMSEDTLNPEGNGANGDSNPGIKKEALEETVTPDTTTAMTGDVSGDSAATGLVLQVECGLNKALLYMDKLMSGSKGACVLFDKSWFTPNEFQYISGRETAKDWKRSIKHFSKSLKLLIAKGLLTVVPATCKCEGCLGNSKETGDGSDCDQVAPSVDNVKNEQAPTEEKPAVACDSDSDKSCSDIKSAPAVDTKDNASEDLTPRDKKKQRKRKSNSTKSEISGKRAKSSSVLDQSSAENRDECTDKAPNTAGGDIISDVKSPCIPTGDDVVPLPATKPKVGGSKLCGRRHSSDSQKGVTETPGADSSGMLQKVIMERLSAGHMSVPSAAQPQTGQRAQGDHTGTYLSPGEQARLSGILNEFKNYKKQLIQKKHNNHNNNSITGSPSVSSDGSGSETGNSSDSDSGSEADSASNTAVPARSGGALFSILNKAKESKDAAVASSGDSTLSTPSMTPVVAAQLPDSRVTQASSTLHYRLTSSSSDCAIPPAKYSPSTVSSSHKTNSTGTVVTSSAKNSQVGQSNGVPSNTEAGSPAGVNNMIFVPPVNPFPYTLIPGYGIISPCIVPGGFYGGMPVPFSGSLPYSDTRTTTTTAPTTSHTDPSRTIPLVTAAAGAQRKASLSQHSTSEVLPATFLPLGSAGACNNTPAHQNHSLKTQRRENNRIHGSWSPNKPNYVCDNSGALDLRVGAKRPLSWEQKSCAEEVIGAAKYTRLDDKLEEKENVVLDLTVRNPK